MPRVDESPRAWPTVRDRFESRGPAGLPTRRGSSRVAFRLGGREAALFRSAAVAPGHPVIAAVRPAPPAAVAIIIVAARARLELRADRGARRGADDAAGDRT